MKIIKCLLSILFLVCTMCVECVYAYPSNATVRVCIMDEKYTTVEKTNVTVYGTNDIIVSNLQTDEELIRLPQAKFLTISTEKDEFILSYIDTSTQQNIKLTSKNNIKISCPDGVIGIKDFVRGGKPALYRNEFRLYKLKSDKFCLVNVLDIEHYLKGVVPCEMPVSFGLEALKSQAVAARVYALTPRTKMSRLYDVVDSVASQVYNGYNRESDIANKAIDETHGIVALYNDEMIIAVFSSTAGGYTECYSETFSDPITGQFPSSEKPYLKSKPDLPEFKPLDNEDDAFEFYSKRPLSYDIHSPLYRWTRQWSKEELQNNLKKNLVSLSKTGFIVPKLESPNDFGELKSIKVTQRGESGKIVFMEIETDSMIYTVSKELIIRRLFTKDGKALPSANVVFKPKYKGKYSTYSDFDEVVAYGGGFGHGCGLSQFGAYYMAKDCKLKFDTILKHYYNGICLGTKPIVLKSKNIAQSFYVPSNKAIMVIPNKGHSKILSFKINDELIDFNLEGYKPYSRVEIDISQYTNPNSLNTLIYYPNSCNHLNQYPIKMYIKLL